jgi:Ankyrin repeats (3 copies)
MELLLERGVDVNLANVRGGTCLHLAAFKGHLRMVEVLLARDANVNARTTSNQNTPLHRAASNQHWEICRLLVRSGADPTLTNRAGRVAFVDVAAEVNVASPTAQVSEAHVQEGEQEKANQERGKEEKHDEECALKTVPLQSESLAEETAITQEPCTATKDVREEGAVEGADERADEDSVVAMTKQQVQPEEAEADKCEEHREEGSARASAVDEEDAPTSTSTSAIQRGRSALQRERRNSILREKNMESKGSLVSEVASFFHLLVFFLLSPLLSQCFFLLSSSSFFFLLLSLFCFLSSTTTATTTFLPSSSSSFFFFLCSLDRML